MKLSRFARYLIVIFVLVFSCFAFFIAISYNNVSKTFTLSSENQTTLRVFRSIEAIFDDMMDMETSHRGYLLTGNKEFLQPYYNALNDYRNELDNLKKVPVTDLQELKNISRLCDLVVAKVAFVKTSLLTFETKGGEVAYKQITTKRGKEIMDSIRLYTRLIETQERANLQRFDAEKTANAKNTLWSFIVFSVVVFSIFVIFLFNTYRSNKQRLAAEQKVRFWAAVATNIQDPIFTTNPNFEITSWNEGAQTLLGWKEDEAVGKVVHDLLRVVYPTVTRSKILADFEHHNYWKGEVIYHTKEGNPLNILVSLTNLKDVNGNITGTVAVAKDITKRKKFETALLEFNTELETKVDERTHELFLEKNLSENIINSLPGVFYLYDQNGKFIRWNKNFETISGYSSAEISGMHPLDFFDVNEKGLLQQQIDKVFETGIADIEAPFLTKNKEHIFYYFNGHRTRFNGIDYLIGMGIDIRERKKAEQEIILEKNLSDSIVNSLPGVFYLADLNGNLLRWNKNFETISGYTAEEISRMRIRDFVALDDQQNLLKKKALAIEQGTSEVGASFLNKQKQEFPYHFTFQLSKYKDQACLLGVAMDISERKKAEHALEESEKKYRLLFQNNPLPMWMLELPSYKIVDVNDAAVIHYGYSRAEFTAMNARDLRPQEDVAQFEKQILRVERQGSNRAGKWRHQKKNGEIIIVEIVTHDIKFDTATMRIVLANDVTDRELAQKELKLSEENYRFLFNNNPAVIFIWDLETLNIIEANETAEALYGYTRQEFLNMTLLDLRSKEEHEKIKAFARQMLHNQAPIGRANWQHLKKGGENMMMDITSHQIIYKGRPSILALAENITEKILIEEELKRSYEDIRQLNTHLQIVREEERAHISRELHDELGQQLTAIKMDIAWLGKKLNVQDDLIGEKFSNSLHLVDDTIKTVRRINTELRPIIIDDLGLFAALDWQAKEFAKRTDITCHIVFDENEPILDKSVAMNVFRIFQETLTNITKHAKATDVEVAVKIENQTMHLSVQDNGIGFDTAAKKPLNSFGLLGMEERAIVLNGKIIITSKKGNGTLLQLIFPLNA